MPQALVASEQERVATVGQVAALRGESNVRRRHELDWLRALAVFGLIPFHAAIVFSTGSRDYVKSGQTSVVMDLLASFITFWGIPLILLIGGGAARFDLPKRAIRAFRFLHPRT